jgi:hypothetical protein
MVNGLWDCEIEIPNEEAEKLLGFETDYRHLNWGLIEGDSEETETDNDNAWSIVIKKTIDL